jgi:hypothetical protein
MHPADWAGLAVAVLTLSCWTSWRCALDGKALSI